MMESGGLHVCCKLMKVKFNRQFDTLLVLKIFSMSFTTRQYEDSMLQEHYFLQNVHFTNYEYVPLTLITMQASNITIYKLETSLNSPQQTRPCSSLLNQIHFPCHPNSRMEKYKHFQIISKRLFYAL